jgi:hypothetical protein
MTNAQKTEATREAPGQLVGLITLSVLSLIAAVVLFLVGLFVGTGTVPTAGEVATKIGLSWWSTFMMTVAVVAFVGTLVLAGVRRMLIGAGLDV